MTSPDPLSAFRAKLRVGGKRGPADKRPWRTMPVGDCFLITFDEAQASSIRSMASSKGKDLRKRFSVTAAANGMWVTREE